jgi:hypothetical protein
MKSTDLCIPIYLNQQIVFDSLAVFDDGFYRLSTIKTASGETEASKSGIGASIGVSNVFALLGVSFSGERGKEKGKQEQMEISQEKIHTPTSLFAKLRIKLQEQELLKYIESSDGFDKMENGDFVEFKAVLRKNPLVDTIEGFKQIMGVATLFTDDKNPPEKVLQKGSRPKNQNQVIMQQMDGMLKALSQSNSVELVGGLISNPKIQVVLTTKLDFFTPGGETEIIDGEFRILGKVIRIIRLDESINLLRKTTFGRLDQKTLSQFFSGFEGIENAGLRIPESVTEIQAPAFQVIPIAIFI